MNRHAGKGVVMDKNKIGMKDKAYRKYKILCKRRKIGQFKIITRHAQNA